MPYMAEMNRTFDIGAGAVVIRKGISDIKLLDDVTSELNNIIEHEKTEYAGKGDHFSAAGANSRIWNSHEKLCMKSPELYARYNANSIVRRLSESWLGTGYQITMQANVVHPSGKAQSPHRDYHMGFQGVEQLQEYPATQHQVSAHLTLQGAIAHSDMPIESGPTKLLPYSQSYLPGYMAIHSDEFKAYFESNYQQLSLDKGDMLFFNPATFHAAGDNNTQDIHRFANLLQVGSAYGRSIEIVDRARISKAVYPTLLSMKQAEALTEFDIDTVVAATAEGYPFPANLDVDSPLTGMAPPSQQDIMRDALCKGLSLDDFVAELDDQQSRKRSH
ncbi:MAG: phytanoyl-CoA dioxygenase family protein [Gammaproteobacteria bacterium]|nr:phytanoyl-CoA dioxygenase family protein [Gammaproteobacteria bacterium]